MSVEKKHWENSSQRRTKEKLDERRHEIKEREKIVNLNNGAAPGNQ